MTNHFHVIDPQGRAHTRSSKGRTYTHTVVYRVGRAAVDRRFARIAEAGDAAGKSYDQTVRESQGIFPKAEQWRGPVALKSWQDHAIKWMATEYADGRDAVIARATARATKDAESYEAGKNWDRYENAGWCGRLDLAHKLAAQYPTCEQVVILEAIAGKPPKGDK